MKDVFLDKKDRVRAWLTPVRFALCCALALVILFVPLWPDFVTGHFVLEPAQRAVIRAEVPGVVEQVLVVEGQAVTPEMPLVRLRNLRLESEAAQASARFRESSARAINAGLRYADFGRAEREREEAAEQNRVLAGQLKHLELTSPMRGIVVTPHIQDLEGSYVDAGAEIAEVADIEEMTARVYIPEFGMRDVRVGAEVRLQMPSRMAALSGTLDSIDPLSSQLDPALVEKSQLSGIVSAPSYVGLVNLENDGSLREGMTGTAKLFVRRRSLAAMVARFARDLIESRFW